MSGWTMKAGRFTDGEVLLSTVDVFEMVENPKWIIQDMADFLGITCKSFVDLAVFACLKLSIPRTRKRYWYGIERLQKERVAKAVKNAPR